MTEQSETEARGFWRMYSRSWPDHDCKSTIFLKVFYFCITSVQKKSNKVSYVIKTFHLSKQTFWHLTDVNNQMNDWNAAQSKCLRCGKVHYRYGLVSCIITALSADVLFDSDQGQQLQVHCLLLSHKQIKLSVKKSRGRTWDWLCSNRNGVRSLDDHLHRWSSNKSLFSDMT